MFFTEKISLSATMWLIDVFSIVIGQQWSSVAPGKKVPQALDKQSILVCMINQFSVGFGLFIAFVLMKKSVEKSADSFKSSVLDCHCSKSSSPLCDLMLCRAAVQSE